MTPQECADNLIREINYIVFDEEQAKKLALVNVYLMIDLFVELPQILDNKYTVEYWQEVENILKNK